VRTTPEGRALIDRAVAASGTDLTDFVISNLTVESRRVLADRTEFALGSEAWEAWERINRRRARSLAGLRELINGAAVAVQRGVTQRDRPPRLLGAGDVMDDFECRSAEQTEWLRHHPRQAHAAGTARALVVTQADSHAVVA